MRGRGAEPRGSDTAPELSAWRVSGGTGRDPAGTWCWGGIGVNGGTGGSPEGSGPVFPRAPHLPVPLGLRPSRCGKPGPSALPFVIATALVKKRSLL